MRRITQEEKAYLLSLTPEDITYELGMELFASHVKNVNGKPTEVKAKFEPEDYFVLKKGEFMNKEQITTSVGSFIFNKFIIEPKFGSYVGYINYEITDSGLGDLESELSQLLLNDVITTDDFADYLNRIQWLGMQFHEPIAASFTMNGLKPNKTVIKRREELLKANKEKIEAGDINTMSAIEKELVALAEKEVGNDPAMDLYYSGARGSIPNNYKQLSILKGPIMNMTIGKYQFIAKSYFEGLTKEELSATGTNMVNGQYPKSCGTAESGYATKQINSLGQAIVLRKDVEDCKTKGYLELVIPKDFKHKFMYRYVIDNGKLVMLTKENIDKYVGKKIKLRSIMYCGCDYGVCLTCAGRLYEKLQIDSIGLSASTLTGALLNLKMKAIHDSSVKLQEVDLNDMTF